MMNSTALPIRFTSVSYSNFKTFENFSLLLRDMNILVGGNNAGKSTALAAFRVLAVALKTARSRSPIHMTGPDGESRLGYNVPTSSFPISIENVHTDYNNEPTRITFKLSNHCELLLYFPQDGGCRLFANVPGKLPRTPSEFRRQIPVTVGIVPVLGPVEHREDRVSEETVQQNLTTHRASRNFRNFWHQENDPALFERFAELVRTTWAGMEIEPPKLEFSMQAPFLSMFCREKRMPRELYWVGFGFQIWCQLLTHIVRTASDTLLVVDEPETYLHPEVQRQLISILRSAGPAIVLATHSSEIIAEADPDELVVIRRSVKRGLRLKDVEGVQQVLNSVGSIQNLSLISLARTRRVLFIEPESFRLLRRFARKLGHSELAQEVGFSVVPLEGANSWEKVQGFAWGLEHTLHTRLAIGIVLERSHRLNEELEVIRQKLMPHLTLVHFHPFQELENALFSEAALARTIERQLQAQESAQKFGPERVNALLLELSDTLKGEVQDQLYPRLRERIQGQERGLDPSEVEKRVRESFDLAWSDLDERLRLVSGRTLMQRLNQRLQSTLNLSVTPARIVEAMRKEEIHPELVSLLGKLDAFRQQMVGPYTDY